MSKPCMNRVSKRPDPRALVRAASTLAFAMSALAALVPSNALAARQPLVMGPLYAEPAPQKTGDTATPHPASPPCAVTIIELADSRREQETLGMVRDFRSIAAPTDRDAWLHSVIQVGLGARGFTPTFDAPGAVEAPNAVKVHVSLHSIWLTGFGSTKSANVVMRMSFGDAANSGRYYRGDLTNVDWANTQGEFRDLLNKTLAITLDAMAVDVRKACPA
jgi:hypothetical protein